MTLARLSIVVGAVIVGTFIILLFNVVPGIDSCSPIGMILGAPFDPPALPHSVEGLVEPTFPYGGCPSVEWTDIPYTLLLLVAPICATFAGVGFVCSRHGGPPSLFRGAIAAVATAFFFCWFVVFGLVPYEGPVPMRTYVIVFLIAWVAAAFGAAGANADKLSAKVPRRATTQAAATE